MASDDSHRILEILQRLVDSDGFGNADRVNKYCANLNDLTTEMTLEHPLLGEWMNALLFAKGGLDFLKDILSAKYTSEQILKATENVKKQTIPIDCKALSAGMGDKSKCGKCPYLNKVVSPCQLNGKTYFPSENTGFYARDPFINKSNPVLQHADLKEKMIEELNLIALNSHDDPLYSFNGKFLEPISDITISSEMNQYTKERAMEYDRREIWKRITTEKRILKGSAWLQESTENHLNFKNGILNLEKMEFLEHSSDFGFTSLLEYPLDKKAKAPRFMEFLFELGMGDPDWVKVMIEWLGYTLVPSPPYAGKCAWFYGDKAGNGKNTMAQAIASILPKNEVTSIRIDKLGDHTHIVQLKKARMNMADEANSISKYKGDGLTSSLNSLITGEPMMVRGAYMRNAFELSNWARLYFMSNNRPELEDVKGWDRRLMVIPFDNTFEENKNQDKFILDKLKAERSGILNLAIEGWYRLKDNGYLFSKCARIEEATRLNIQNKNVHHSWVHENLEKSPENLIIKDILYQKYRGEMLADGNMPLNKQEFFKVIKSNFQLNLIDMDQRKINHVGNRVRAIKGIDIALKE